MCATKKGRKGGRRLGRTLERKERENYLKIQEGLRLYPLLMKIYLFYLRILRSICHHFTPTTLSYPLPVFKEYISFSLGFSTALVCYGCHNKIPQTVWVEEQKKYCLIALEARNPRSRCQQSWFPLWPLSLACVWLPSHRAFIWSSMCLCHNLLSL